MAKLKKVLIRNIKWPMRIISSKGFCKLLFHSFYAFLQFLPIYYLSFFMRLSREFYTSRWPYNTITKTWLDDLKNSLTNYNSSIKIFDRWYSLSEYQPTKLICPLLGIDTNMFKSTETLDLYFQNNTSSHDNNIYIV